MTEKERDPRGRHKDSAKTPKCLKCFNLRTRIFRDRNELKSWCEKNEIDIKQLWLDRIGENKKKGLRLFWCPLARRYAPTGIIRPRMMLNTSNHKTFIKDCQMEDLDP